MGKPTGFMELPRIDRTYAPAGDRVRHYNEFINPLSDGAVAKQGGSDAWIAVFHFATRAARLII